MDSVGEKEKILAMIADACKTSSEARLSRFVSTKYTLPGITKFMNPRVKIICSELTKDHILVSEPDNNNWTIILIS